MEGWQAYNRTQPDDGKWGMSSHPNAARKLEMRVYPIASFPPSLTGFSCQPRHAGDRWLPNPRIGIVQRHPMLRMKSVDGWQLKLALGTRSQGCKVVIRALRMPMRLLTNESVFARFTFSLTYHACCAIFF